MMQCIYWQQKQKKNSIKKFRRNQNSTWQIYFSDEAKQFYVFRQKVIDDYRDGSINNIVNYGDDGTTQLPRKKAPKFGADAHFFLK